jgi:Tfp pilus assembly protein PilV
MCTSRNTTLQSSDSGFGMIEIVVSMFLIAVLTIAFLPLLIQGLRVSATNTTLATATQLVSQQLDKTRAQGTTCAVFATYAAVTVGNLQSHRSRGACPVTYPGTVLVRVWATQTGSADAVSEATTLILVTAAS